ncbi:MAG TPA: DUF86 domain-containing protein [bacterium]|nr:DUF86 domain-containing protein [bacterium]HQO33467.1 DUF86 domain-containing protein [bacterium]HQP97024.1 DUF86 domain-containing protein [bacterium]
MKKDPRIYVVQILESAQMILNYTIDGKEFFLAQKVVQHAVLWNFEVMGEAAKRVPDEYRQRYPEIPWRMMAAFRDVLIHNYEGIDLIHVWEIIETEIPRLCENIREILPPLDRLEADLTNLTQPD